MCVYHGVYTHIDFKRYLGAFHYGYYTSSSVAPVLGSSRSTRLLRSCRLLLLYRGAAVVRQYSCSTTVLLLLAIPLEVRLYYRLRGGIGNR